MKTVVFSAEMSDPKKPLSTGYSSSLINTTNPLLSTKSSILSSPNTSSTLKTTNTLNSSSLNTGLTNSLLLTSTLSKPSSLLQSKQTLTSPSTQLSSNLFGTTGHASALKTSSAFPTTSSSLLKTTTTIPTATSSFLKTTTTIPTTTSSFLKTNTASSTTNSQLFNSALVNTSSSLVTESSLSRKRKAETNETVSSTTQKLQGVEITNTQEPVVKSVPPTVYKNENIPPVASSIHLNFDSHSILPKPKRPRIDPFDSIFTHLENDGFKDEDANIGVKSIKVIKTQNSWNRL